MELWCIEYWIVGVVTPCVGLGGGMVVVVTPCVGLGRGMVVVATMVATMYTSKVVVGVFGLLALSSRCLNDML